jgi:HD superfamily phosphohydrolase
MPNWGLSETARRTEPYGLKPWCLEPGKVITDPIHGDIFITVLEQLILDTPPLQRLRRVRQLGTTHSVYPGAVHTRLAHSLGAVRVVQTLLDAAIDQRNGNHPEADLFGEWESLAKGEAEGFSSESLEYQLAEDLGEDPWRILFRRKIAEAIVLARLGALLHDIGHVPFGHTIEDDLKLLTPHDQNRPRLVRIWAEVRKSCFDQIRESARRDQRKLPTAEERIGDLASLAPPSKLYSDLEYLILSSEKNDDGERIDPVDNITYPFVADMVGNTICADLLDYLERDHVFTGLPVSLGKRYLSSFYITPKSAGGIYSQRMSLLVHRNGRERRDIVTEILKHLRYRYELQERVLVHHTKLAADAMVGKMFELWMDAKKIELEADPGELARVDKEIEGQPEGFVFPGDGKKGDDGVTRAAHWKLERLLLGYGDDGVLEHVADELGEGQVAASAALARGLLSRNLYKPAANVLRPAAAEDLFKKFGSTEARRNLEQLACKHAGIPEDWHLVLWIPDPDMRLKLAELLVNDGKGVAKFKDKSPLGSDIYSAHEALWTISVFVHPSVTIEQTRSALAKVGQRLGVSWDAHKAELGPEPADAPEHLAAARALEKPRAEAHVTELITELKSPEKLRERAARGDEPETQTELDREARSIAEAYKWTGPATSPENQP